MTKRNRSSSGDAAVPNEQTKRIQFAGLQVITGLAASLGYYWAFTANREDRQPIESLVVAIIALPAISFAGLAYAAMRKHGDRFRVGWFGLWTSAIFGYISTAVPPLAIAFVLFVPQGGGANIGLGLICLACPIFMPFFMLAALTLPWKTIG